VQKLFGEKWDLYATGQPNQAVALPVNTPKAGLQGQGARIAILGEAPTPVNDVNAYRNCFGFPGTALQIHGASNIAPILESSLDAMTVAMVAPKLSRLDLWVKTLGQADPQGALKLCYKVNTRPARGIGCANKSKSTRRATVSDEDEPDHSGLRGHPIRLIVAV
jgi:hypothetical protein